MKKRMSALLSTKNVYSENSCSCMRLLRRSIASVVIKIAWSVMVNLIQIVPNARKPIFELTVNALNARVMRVFSRISCWKMAFAKRNVVKDSDSPKASNATMETN